MQPELPLADQRLTTGAGSIYAGSNPPFSANESTQTEISCADSQIVPQFSGRGIRDSHLATIRRGRRARNYFIPDSKNWKKIEERGRWCYGPNFARYIHRS
jgi:hypothetical protein